MKNTRSLKFETNIDIENINAHSITQQLRPDLGTLPQEANCKVAWSSE